MENSSHEVAQDGQTEPVLDTQVDQTAPAVDDSSSLAKNEPSEAKNNTESEEKKALQEEAKQAYAKKMQNFIDSALKYKADGNEFFKSGDFKKARSKYTRVFAYTKPFMSGGDGQDGMVNMAMQSQAHEISDEMKEQAKGLERDVNNNMAIIFLKEKNFSKAIEKSNKSLQIESNVKGFYNRGRAYTLKNDFESAYKDFTKGKEMFPDKAKLFDDELDKTKKLEKEYDKYMAKKYSGFLDK